MSTIVWTDEQIIAGLKQACLLTQTEAEACLRRYRDGDDFAGEAVNHCGGTFICVNASLHWLAEQAEMERALVPAP